MGEGQGSTQCKPKVPSPEPHKRQIIGKVGEEDKTGEITQAGLSPACVGVVASFWLLGVMYA